MLDVWRPELCDSKFVLFSATVSNHLLSQPLETNPDSYLKFEFYFETMAFPSVILARSALVVMLCQEVRQTWNRRRFI